MPGLSEKEHAGLKNILSSMTAGDLMSLSDTVTNKMIVVENVTGKICTRQLVYRMLLFFIIRFHSSKLLFCIY